MKFVFKPNNDDDDVVETVEFTRKELRAIATMAKFYTTNATAARTAAANRLFNAIDRWDCGDWSELFKENHA